MNTYEVSWVSNQGGRLIILSDEIVAEDEGQAEEQALLSDYYSMEITEVIFIKSN